MQFIGTGYSLQKKAAMFFLRREPWGALIRQSGFDTFTLTDSDAMSIFGGLYTDLKLGDVTAIDGADILDAGILPTRTQNTNLVENQLSGPIAVGIQVTTLCNIRCSYCFATPRHTSTSSSSIRFNLDVAKAVLALNPLSVWLSGGEPFLCENLLEVISIWDNRPIDIMIDTNGTIYNDELITELCRRGNVTLRVSLDAVPAEQNDIHREQGLKVISNLQKFVDSGINIRVHSVATKQNYSHLREMLNFIEDIGVPFWTVFNLVPAGWARKHFQDLHISMECVREEFSKIKTNCHVEFVDGSSDRSMILVSETGDLYTVSVVSGKRLSGGNLLVTPISDCWQQLPLDCQSHIRKYTGSKGMR